jgi:hypothetical protein
MDGLFNGGIDLKTPPNLHEGEKGVSEIRGDRHFQLDYPADYKLHLQQKRAENKSRMHYCREGNRIYR